MGTFWTDERCDYLREMVASSANFTAGDMAWRLGCSRNTIIGKVRRLGLKLPQHVTDRPAKPHAARERERARNRRAAAGVTPKFVAKALGRQEDAPPMVGYDTEPEMIDNIIPIGQRRTLLELTEDTCRWPIGDPGSADFFFCGGESDNIKGRPYCSYHSRVAYQPRISRLRTSIPPRSAR